MYSTFATEGVPPSQSPDSFRIEITLFPASSNRRHAAIKQQDQFGIRLVGKGTSALCGLSPGDRLSALGPLGRGFDLRHVSQPGDIVIVGGGKRYFPAALFGRPNEN